MSAKLSIITPCWNKSHLIKGYIANLNKVMESDSKKNTELILVNDGSTDDTKEFLINFAENGKEYRNVFALNLPDNHGFAAANNIGALAATGDFLLFVNNDVVWKDDPYPAFIASCQDDTRIVGAHLLSHDTGHNVLKGKPVPYLEGWCVCMSYEVYNRLSDHMGRIFDEVNFPIAYFEDVDLSLRAILEGIELKHDPTLPIWHLGSQTTQRTRGFRYNERSIINREAFVRKWDHLKGDEW